MDFLMKGYPPEKHFLNSAKFDTTSLLFPDLQRLWRNPRIFL